MTMASRGKAQASDKSVDDWTNGPPSLRGGHPTFDTDHDGVGDACDPNAKAPR